MKKVFKIGFIIGVFYIFIFALVIKITGSEGLGVLLDILIQPAGFIIFGILEYLLRSLDLRDLLFNNFFILWSLMALVEGIFFGLVFAAIKKLFTKTVN